MIVTQEISRYQPSYITENSPNFYGGKQEEYIKLAEQAIESGVNIISDGIKNKVDLAITYHKVVKALQNARHEIALLHQPELAHLFGIRRDDSKTHQSSYITPVTGLYSNFKEYNEKYMGRLTQILQQIPHDLKTFRETSIKVHETIMGRKCTFHVELLDIPELEKRKYMKLPQSQELWEALGIEGITPLEITHDYNLMNQLKLQHKELYDRIILGSILKEINSKFPSPQLQGKIDEKPVICFERKSIYVLATLCLELEPEKMLCIARHMTWMYQDWQQDPIERMHEHSVDFVIHQDPFLIERTQNTCAPIFSDILTWNKATSSLEDLKERVALLRFAYGNSMPCARGDGSVGDWLELAIYRFHGFKNTRHNNDLLPCYELLATTNLSQYLEDYKKTIIVE